ncbi:MAG TPA: ABC transporter ATP-binding protein [Actinomycetales bacterium]|nr:ABC transporter ATP-binding protein [Actinomycetales bacterium]
MLEVKNLHASYGDVAVLHDVNLHVEAGEIIAVVGSNGAGKTTLMRALSGLMTNSRRMSSTGTVLLDGEDVSRRAASERLRRGLALVPEGRQVWPELPVKDNLLLGGFTRRRESTVVEEQLDFVLSTFPRLGERLGQDAGTLSGGEQQMLAIGRALMSRPKLMLFDEPSMGLAPVIVDLILPSIAKLRDTGTTVVLVEQMVNLALEIADRGYVLERGHVVVSGTPAELTANDKVRAAYLGVTSETFESDD